MKLRTTAPGLDCKLEFPSSDQVRDESGGSLKSCVISEFYDKEDTGSLFKFIFKKILFKNSFYHDLIYM